MSFRRSTCHVMDSCVRPAALGSILLPAIVAAMIATPAAAKGPLNGGAFDVYSVDDQGGGWVINRIPARGDMLWGCEDVTVVNSCRPVPMPDFIPATALNFFHVSEDSQSAWLRVSVPGIGDSLMACYDPEGRPYCEKVELELNPPTSTLAREWPDYDNVVAEAATAGGGPMAALLGSDANLPPDVLIEPSSRANMWLSAAIKVPGPVNLYACHDLEGEPVCTLAIPDYMIVDRENVGIKKIEEVATKASRSGVGIMVEDVTEGSAADEADIRAGDVIVRVCGFEIKNERHFKGLLVQIPATYAIPVEFENGDKVKIRVNRKSNGKS